jgi:ADP-ribose pyrophosphatase YjhB (NUDIX family)
MVFLYHCEYSEPIYLLLKRNLELGGYWQPVTGFIEPPETNRQAALRELGEETGVKDYKRVIDPKHSFSINMNGLQCSVSVLAVETARQPQVRLSFEHTDYIWLNYTDARSRLYWENNRETLDKLHRKLQQKK